MIVGLLLLTSHKSLTPFNRIFTRNCTCSKRCIRKFITPMCPSFLSNFKPLFIPHLVLFSTDHSVPDRLTTHELGKTRELFQNLWLNLAYLSLSYVNTPCTWKILGLKTAEILILHALHLLVLCDRSKSFTPGGGRETGVRKRSQNL